MSQLQPSSRPSTGESLDARYDTVRSLSEALAALL